MSRANSKKCDVILPSTPHIMFSSGWKVLWQKGDKVQPVLLGCGEYLAVTSCNVLFLLQSPVCNVLFLLHYKYWLIFMRMKQKKIQKKFKNGRLKKTEFFNSANSQYFFSKISWIGPWVSRIDWCEGHWCGSTYMAVRLSDISSKTGKKCIFCVFRPFLSLCRTASRPYRLSHIAALRINQSY